MKRFTHSTWRVLAGCVLLLLAVSCSKTEGNKVDNTLLGLQSCSADAQCMPASCNTNEECKPSGYCDAEDGFCRAECRKNDDCWLWGQTEENPLECRNFRCQTPLAASDLDDETETETTTAEAMVCFNHKCIEASSKPCVYRTADDCAQQAWNCLDDECTDHRPAASCGDAQCVGACSGTYPDLTCGGVGYKSICHEEGLCITLETIDFGTGDENSNASEWIGVWGGILTTAVINSGLPLVGHQDTVSIHNMLVKVYREGANIIFRWHLCYLTIRNFKGEKVDPPGPSCPLSCMVVPEPYMQNVAVIEHMLKDPPLLEKGQTFVTSNFCEVRGAFLEDVYNDPIPKRSDYADDATCKADCLCDRGDKTTKDCCEMHEMALQACMNSDPRLYDQDSDGKLGMTTLMVGVLNMEVYSDQKWCSRLHGEIVDKDHVKGIMEHTNEQYQLASNLWQEVYDLITVPHEDDDRSYFRLQRMDDNATCSDVWQEFNKEGSWLSFTPHLDGIPNP